MKTPVNTEKASTETLPSPIEILTRGGNSTLPKEVSTNTSRSSINTEKKDENEPTKTSQELRQMNSMMKQNVDTENNATNLENKATDNKINTQDKMETPITTENSVELEMSSQKNINTENTNTETTEEVISENNKPSNTTDIPAQELEALNVNTEKTIPTNSTLKTSNQTNIKEDWSSLMFSSDDSLFDKMTKQLEDDTARNGVKQKSPTSTITTASTSTQDQDTLPDIVYSGKTSDAVTGLLMLGADMIQSDAEIDNDLVMPVNKPKQPDISKPNTVTNSKKQNKQKNKKRSQDHTEPQR